jgi:hypothetical protein
MTKELDNLIMNSLACKKEEYVSLIYDETNLCIANCLSNYLSLNNFYFKKFKYEYSYGRLITHEILDILLGSRYQVIIFALKNNIWHLDERKKAKYEKGKRLVSLVHPLVPCLSYSSDLDEIYSIGKLVEQFLKKNRQLVLKTDKGTNLKAKIPSENDYESIFFENGRYDLPSSGGDFPAGEVGFGPVRGSVTGRLVIDSKVQFIGGMVSHPLILQIENDRIVEVSGKYAQDFRQLIRTDPALAYIAEISFGVNPILVNITNKDSIAEEKNLGTFHCGFGGNSSYGTRKGPHFDVVINQPNAYFDGKLLIEEGKIKKI